MVKVTDIQESYNQSWVGALEQFLCWKRAEGISEQTHKDYDSHVRRFFRNQEDSFNDPLKLKKNLLTYLGQAGIKPCTFNNRLVYLRTFLNWFVEQEFIGNNPIHKIKKRKDEGRVVNIEEEVLINLLSLPDKHTFVRLRDYALILLTLDCGIRPKEALSLAIHDFNSHACEIYITSQKAKTRVYRTLPISIPTVKAIKKSISVRPMEWGSEAPIFCTNEGMPLNRHTWGDKLERYGSELGTHIRPYDLRHTFALEYIRNGANALALQKTLGHSDLK